MVRIAALWMLSAAALLIAFGNLELANAQESGVPDCLAMISGVQADESTTIVLRRDEQAAIDATYPDNATTNVIYIDVFGRLWEVRRTPSSGAEWQGNFGVEEFARWGTGLYRVVWESIGEDEVAICQVSTFIQIEGSLFRSVGGLIALAGIVIGLTGITLTFAKATIVHGARWAIRLVVSGDVEREDGQFRIRRSYSISQTMLGTLLGLILGGASLATLPQAAFTIPTIELALVVVIPFAALGALAGWFSLVREQPT